MRFCRHPKRRYMSLTKERRLFALLVRRHRRGRVPMSGPTAPIRRVDNDPLYQAAVSAGCRPFWHDGIFGFAWHCGCHPEPVHAYDQQCSMITFKSLGQK